MKHFLFILAANLGLVAAIAAAAYLAANHIEGWGWFLFVGVLISNTVEFTTKRDANT